MNTRKNLLIIIGEWWEARRTESSTVATSQKPGRVSRLIRWFLPNGGTLLLVLLLIATQSVWARTLQSPATPGPSATTVNYQGRLADSGGTTINGIQTITFAIYDAATNGNLIWGPETHVAIPVSNSLFSEGLGSLLSIPTTTWNGDRYLGPAALLAASRWIVDPLDGTTNFVHGFPFYAVSIAAAVEGVLEAAVVLQVDRGDLYTAARGHGAWLG